MLILPTTHVKRNLRHTAMQDDLGQDSRPFLCIVEAPGGATGGSGGGAALGCCVVDVASGQVC